MAKKENPYFATVANYKRVFGTPEGKKVLRHLMKMHGIMTTSYIEGDSHSTAFNEGARNVVIQILNKIRMDLVSLEKEIEQTPEGDDDVII